MAAIFDLVSVDFLTNTWVDWSNFLVAHWGDWRKVPFHDQHRRSSNMAATEAILDLVSINYLTNACVDWFNLFCGSWHNIPLFHNVKIFQIARKIRFLPGVLSCFCEQ
jgi:hypothetical protein